MRRLLPIFLFAFLALNIPLFAATRVWTGTTSGTWSVPSNWGGTAPSPGDDLVFSSTNNAGSLNDDYPANTAFHSITFNVSGNFLLTGNAIDIGSGGITVTGGASANTSTPLTLTAPQTWTCDLPGQFSTQTVDLAGNSLALAGNQGIIIFNGTVSGGAGTITLAGTVEGLFGSNATYTGATTVNSAATVDVESSGSIVTPFTINNGGTLTAPTGAFPVLSSTLALNSGSTYKAFIGGAASGQYTEVTIAAGVTLAGNLVLGGAIVVPAGSVLTILQTTGGGTITGTFAGVPDGGVVSGNVQSYQVHYTSTSVTLTALSGTAAPPSLSKSFGQSGVPVGGSTSLTFTVTNTNPGKSLSGVGFNDPLPAGLVVATPNNMTGSCGGGTITATAGSSNISLSGATLAASAVCTFSVDVTGTSPGLQFNQTTSITSTEGGNGNQASASLKVFGPATISKAFGASAIPSGATTTLTFTLGNPVSNPGVLSDVSFSDSLPAGMTVATPSGASTDCTSATWTATAGSTTLFLSGSGATIAPGSTCTAVVNVTSSTPGTANNTSGAVTSVEGPTGSTASASLNVLSPGTTAPPALSKSFGAAQIPVGGTTSLTFKVSNLNSAASLTNVGFNDPLPAGLAVSTPNGLSGSCGGGTITAAAGSSSVALSGATLAANSACTFSVNVTGTSAGQQNNQTTNVTSTEGGAGNQGKATVAVVGPPTVSKAFSPSTITAGGTSTLTFTFGNPASNSEPLTNIAISDTLPAGMTTANPMNFSDTCVFSTTTVSPGASSMTFSGADIRLPGSTCTVSLDVTSNTPGIANNTSGTVTSGNGGTGSTASASLTVLGSGATTPPSISKSFGAATIPVGGATSLTFTVNNPNSGTSLSNIGFTDPLPSGLAVATPNGLSGSCGGGAITAAAGGSSVSLSGATLAASTSCTFSINVTGTSAGTMNNQTSQVTSAEGGNGNQATATLSVLGPPSIAKAFGAGSISAGGTTTLTFTLGNSGANPLALNGVSFSDSLPSGMTVASPAGVTTNCSGATFAPASGASTLSFSGATINPGTSCTATVNVTSSTPGTANNTTGAVSSTNGGTGSTASATLGVTAAAAAPTISKVFGAVTMPVGGTTSLSFTVQNPSSGASLSNIGFNDPLPAGLVVATPNGLSGSCGGGTITATAGSGTISLSGAALGASAGCTFSVNVTGTTAGTKNNQTTNVTSTEAGSGNQATATVTVSGPPTIAKAFGASSINSGGTTTLTFTLGNPAANLVALTGVSFTDSLPAGMTVAPLPGATTNCPSATFAPVAGGSTITFSGANINPGVTCTATVNITSNTPGTANNTTSNVSSTNGGTGSTASASLTVKSAPATAVPALSTVVLLLLAFALALIAASKLW